MDTTRILKTAFLCSWPLVIFAFNYFTAREQWEPFVQSPLGQTLLGVAFVCLILGAVTQLFIQIGWLRKIAFFFLVMLPSLVFIVGPAILTIAQALGVGR